MQEYKIGRATVRIHGAVDQENIKAATINFLKKVERKRKNENAKNKGRLDRH